MILDIGYWILEKELGPLRFNIEHRATGIQYLFAGKFTGSLLKIAIKN